RAMGVDQVQQAWVDRAPDGGSRGWLRCGTAWNFVFRNPRHVLDRHLDAQLQLLAIGGVDDGDGAIDGGLAGAGEFVVELDLGGLDGRRRPFSRAFRGGAWFLRRSRF